MLNILELRNAFATVSVNLAVAQLAPCLGELGFSSSQVLYCLRTKNALCPLYITILNCLIISWALPVYYGLPYISIIINGLAMPIYLKI